MASPTITFRLPEATDAALSALAEMSGRPVGDLCREGVERVLREVDMDDLLDQLSKVRAERDQENLEALRRGMRTV